MINESLFTNKSNEWSTPDEFFNELNNEFHFTLDPCATALNAKCTKFYTKKDDGLSKSWTNEIVFCNPPYGSEIKKWIKKSYFEAQNGATVVLLIPARTDTKYFHEYIYNKHEIRFVKGRLHFNNSKQSAPFPSMLVVMKGFKHDNQMVEEGEKDEKEIEKLNNDINDALAKCNDCRDCEFYDIDASCQIKLIAKELFGLGYRKQEKKEENNEIQRN